MDWLGPQEWSAVALSLRVAFWATLASLPLGVFMAYVLARWEFPGKFLVNGLVHLPLVMPPVVTGYLLLITFGTRGQIGGFLQELGVVFAFRWTGAALAAGVMGFPLMVRAIRLSIEAVDPRLEEAASTLGAPRLWVFATVTLPLALPGIIAGAILGKTQTIPLAIYSFLQVPGAESSAFRLVVVSVAVALLALLLSEAIARRVARRVGGA
jgi:molybdate transport system permease protein